MFLLAFLFSFFASFSEFSGMVSCSVNPDPNFIDVRFDGRRVDLTPHGLESIAVGQVAQDTRNLQWIFDNYPHADINLASGIFHISELITSVGYQGKIKGDGHGSTFLTGRGAFDSTVNNYAFPALTTEYADETYPTGIPHLFHFRVKDGDVNDWRNTQVDLSLRDLTINMEGFGPLVSFRALLPDGSEQVLPFRSIWSYIWATDAHPLLHNITGGYVSRISISAKNCNFIANTVYFDLPLPDGSTYTSASPQSAWGFLVYGGENWLTGVGLTLQGPNSLFGWTEDDHSPVNLNFDLRDCYMSGFHQGAMALEQPSSKQVPQEFTVFPDGQRAFQYTYPTNPIFPVSKISIKNNVFDNVGNGAFLPSPFGFSVFVLNPSYTDVEIKENHFLNLQRAGVVLLKGMASKIAMAPSDILIKENVFEMAGIVNPQFPIFITGAVAVFDGTYLLYGNDRVVVQENQIIGGTNYAGNQVELLIGSNVVVKENIFEGEAKCAVAVGNATNPADPTQPLPVQGCLVKENDYSNLNAQVKPFILGTYANIPLYPGFPDIPNVLEVENVNNVLDLSFAGRNVIEVA